ncbi:MAG: SdiA-regulated domain-containing protein [Solimonas sp.]
MLLSSAALLSACHDDNNNDGDILPPSDPLTLSLAFKAPGTSFDIANYTRVGQYGLPTSDDAANRLASEASAVTYDKDTDSLYVVGDSSTAVVQINKTNGQLIDSMVLAAAPGQPQDTYFYDTEGLTYVGGGKFMLVEERYRQVDLFTYVPGTTLEGSAVQTVKLGTTIGNIGLEGASYDPKTSGYIFVKEKDPIGVFATTIDFAAHTASNGSATTENSTNLFDPALLNVADLADVFAVSNVTAADATDYGDLLLLSQESGLVLQTDRAGKIKGRLDIGLTAQNEGMTMDGDHTLYLVNELGGGDGHPQLWIYKPAASRDAVGIHSSVYLTFSKPVSAGTGYIVLDDGAGDVRAISVTDSDQLTISEGTVKISPEEALIPGKHYSITVPDGAFKNINGDVLTSVGSLTDLSFTTVGDIEPPTLVTSTPADNSVGITDSEITLTFTETVKASAGNIVITGNDGDVRTILVTDTSQVTINGTGVAIKPNAVLHPGVTYNVQIAAGVITDVAGNAYAGLTTAEALNFKMSPSAGQTILSAGDVMFVAMNGDSPDAMAFMLLKPVTEGTKIGFTDKDYSASQTAWPINEAAFTWTADASYAAGTVVTVQTSAPSADIGVVSGIGGGVGNAETYYAFQGTITDAAAGNITVERFLAALNIGGGAAGDIPQAVIDAGAYLSFAEDNVKYTGSLDASDIDALKARVKDSANWTRDDATAFPITNGTLFPEAPTLLKAGDLLFVAANADAVDAVAFVLLKPVNAFTRIDFTDKDYSASQTAWPTNEAAFTWKADVAYPAGTIVTLQPDATPIAASKGTASGAGGGLSGSAETYYAFQGTITDAAAGAITVDRFLAALNVAGAAAGDIPDSIAAAGAYLSFTEDNVKYNGSTDASDVAALAALIKNAANWQKSDSTAFPLTDGSLFP